MNLLRRFWAWLNDPRCKGTGVRVNDWLTDEEKHIMANEPEHFPFDTWLKIAQNRKYAAQEARNAVWGLGTAALIFGPILLFAWWYS